MDNQELLHAISDMMDKKLDAWIGSRFDGIDERFDTVEKRLDGMDARFIVAQLSRQKSKIFIMN